MVVCAFVALALGLTCTALLGALLREVRRLPGALRAALFEVGERQIEHRSQILARAAASLHAALHEGTGAAARNAEAEIDRPTIPIPRPMMPFDDEITGDARPSGMHPVYRADGPDDSA